jgi:ATP-dependent RNA helicase DHX36
VQEGASRLTCVAELRTARSLPPPLQYGFTSKSHGKGETRVVHVSKPKAFRPVHVTAAYDLPLGAVTCSSLDALFSQYPATPAELASAARGGEEAWGVEGADEEAGGRRKGRGAQEVGAAAGRFTPEESLAAHAALEARVSAPAMASLVAVRRSLPIAAYRAQIVQLCSQHQVVVLAGQTGCGKTTQVPQYLLEEAWAAGRPARILCTQPRRISAVSVAERVAAERGERCGEPGSCVGYSIRLETRAHPRTALLFCTNGVLLRKLTQAGHGEDGLEWWTRCTSGTCLPTSWQSSCAPCCLAAPTCASSSCPPL